MRANSGLRWRGFEVVALCDVQQARRREAKATFEKLYDAQGARRRGIALYNEFREFLANKDVDAVYIAPPDHWHVPMLIAAQEAGKAVHCEKPLGVSAEQDLPRSRQCTDSLHAIELVWNGRIGRVMHVYVASPASIAGGSGMPEPVPPGIEGGLVAGSCCRGAVFERPR